MRIFTREKRSLFEYILEVKDKYGGGGGDNKQRAIEDMVGYTKVHQFFFANELVDS